MTWQLKLFDDALAASDEMIELDLFDLSLSLNLVLHPLHALDASEPQVSLALSYLNPML